MKRIGLVVGLGVEAGLFYYERLLDGAKERGVTLDLVMAHADVATANGFARTGNVDGLADYLGGLIQSLAGAGCDVAAISAATPHMCIQQVTQRASIPLVSIIDVARATVTQRRLQRFSLLGTKRVIESDLYGAFAGLGVVRPRSDESDEIDRIYVSLALSGKCSDEDWQRLLTIATGLRERERLDALLIAGTDFSPLFSDRGAGLPCIDLAQAHVDAILAAALN